MQDRRSTKTKTPGFWLSLFKWFMVVVTVVMAIALVFGYLAQVVNPNTFWLFYFFGLGGQLLILINILLVLMWLTVWSAWAFIPGLVLLSGIGIVGQYIRPTFSKQYEIEAQKPQKDEISIITYNVHNFTQYTKMGVSTIDSITSYVSRQKYDVVCFQEFTLVSKQDSTIIARRMQDFDYQQFSYIHDYGYTKSGNAIFSRYPIVNMKSINLGDYKNAAMSADIIIGQDTVSLFNCHMQSTAYNQVNPKGISFVIEQDDSEQIIRKIGSSLHENDKIRALQADTLASIMEQYRYPKILVGDFNSPAMSYSYNRLRGKMSDTFVEKGRAYEYTYKSLRRLFRIDYILHSDDDKIETISHKSPNLPWSDHKPVVATLKIHTQQR